MSMDKSKFAPKSLHKAAASCGAIYLGLCLFGSSASSRAGALEKYVAQPDATFSWRKVNQQKAGGYTITHLELSSQKWRDHVWQHHLQVVRPDTVRHADIAFLFITGDGDGTKQLGIVKTLAERAGAVAAVLTQVPAQPLYDGRREDALIAFTLLQYLQTGDETWPLLFPMVKSAVRAMDAVQAFAANEYNQKIERFAVGGASKRGWTTWLTAAVDARVKAIAPMVIDMLNVPEQVKWAEKVYGRQSEKIHDYTDLNLIGRLDEPQMATLRQWIDPYSYRERYTMPKLLLLGSNDPYWTVDSLRHYWNDLPAPKLVYQTPNAGHDLAGGNQALQTLAAFFEMIAAGKELPKMEWHFSEPSKNNAEVQVKVDQSAKSMRLWTAYSQDRDFRNDRWTSQELAIRSGSSQGTGVVATPAKGYRAFMAEVVLTSPTGHEYKLSTEARVTPDNIK